MSVPAAVSPPPPPPAATPVSPVAAAPATPMPTSRNTSEVHRRKTGHPAFSRASEPVEREPDVATTDLPRTNVIPMVPKVPASVQEAAAEEPALPTPTPMDAAPAPQAPPMDAELLRRMDELSARVAGLSTPAATPAAPAQERPQFDVDGFEHLDADGVKELRAKLIDPMVEFYERKLAAQQQQFEERLSKYDGRFAEQDQMTVQQKQAKTDMAITSVHPDAQAWLNSKEWATYAARVMPGSLTPIHETVVAAYNAGNHDVVNYHLAQMKAGLMGKPSTPAVSGGGNAKPAVTPPAESAAKFKRADLHAVVQAYNSGQMTRQDYKKFRADYDAAKAAGLVE